MQNIKRRNKEKEGLYITSQEFTEFATRKKGKKRTNEERVSLLTKKIWILIVLNALDSFFTYIGVMAGYAEELNPIVLPFVQNQFFMIGVKVVLVTAILIGVIYLLKNTSKYRLGFASALINFAFYTYIIVTLNHLWVLWQMSSSLSQLDIFII